MTKARDVQPLNSKAKDTFFKRVYCSEERLKRLAAFLLGREISEQFLSVFRDSWKICCNMH